LINKAAQSAGMPWPIIFANQNMPRVAKPYIVINPMTIDIPDHLIYQTIDGDGNQIVSGWRKVVVESQIYNGINSLQSASKLALVLQTNALIEYQVEIDCAIGQRLFLSYVPELLNESQYEGRAIYHFEFFYTENVPDNIGVINSVEFHGSYVQTHSNPDHDTPLIDIDIVCDEVISAPITMTWDDGAMLWDDGAMTWIES
jgi:hypothetical protein